MVGGPQDHGPSNTVLSLPQTPFRMTSRAESGDPALRVALMIDSLTIGGAQKHIRQLACHLSARGHAVWVICLNDHPHEIYLTPLRAAGVRVSVLGRRNVLSGSVLITLPFRLLAWRCDVIAVTLFVSTIVGRLVGAVIRIPILNCLQARNVDYTFWQLALVRLTSPLSLATVSNSLGSIGFSSEYEGTSVRTSTYVDNFQDCPFVFPEDRLPEDVKRVMRLKAVRIVSLGRLVPQKGYDRLIEALAALPRSLRENLRITLFGRGSAEAELRARADELGVGEFLCFAGEHEGAAGFLHHFDVYVQPSRFEGTPNALQEAISSGLPVFAQHIDGMPQLVEKAAAGWTVPSDAFGDWTEVLTYLATNPLPRRSASSFIEEDAAKLNSSVLNSYEEILRGMLN